MGYQLARLTPLRDVAHQIRGPFEPHARDQKVLLDALASQVHPPQQARRDSRRTLQRRLGLLAHGAHARLSAEVLGQAIAVPMRADLDQLGITRPQCAGDLEEIAARLGKVLSDCTDALCTRGDTAWDRVDRAEVVDSPEDDGVAVAATVRVVLAVKALSIAIPSRLPPPPHLIVLQHIIIILPASRRIRRLDRRSVRVQSGARPRGTRAIHPASEVRLLGRCEREGSAARWTSEEVRVG